VSNKTILYTISTGQGQGENGLTPRFQLTKGEGVS